MLVIGLCDENEQLKRELSMLLENVFFQVTDIRMINYSSCAAMADALQGGTQMPDLILFDIGLPDGIRMAEYVKNYMQRTTVIAYTGTAQYVFDGYAYGLYAYVLKTQTHEKLVAALRRFIREKLEGSSEFLSVRAGGCIQHIRLGRVQYFESRGRKISAVTMDENFEFYQKMDVLCGVLPPGEFIRCHQSYTVNVSMIHSYTTGSITLKTGLDIPVSRKYLTDLKEKIIQPNFT